MNRLVGKDPKRFGLKRLVSAPVEVTGAVIGGSKGFSVEKVGSDILPKRKYSFYESLWKKNVLLKIERYF